MYIDLGNLFARRQAQSRSINAENFRGEKGKGGMDTPETARNKRIASASRELGVGNKVSPCLDLAAGETVEIMDNDGPGIIRHIWMTLAPAFYRDVIVRMYWDGEDEPSVESPIGDFFCNSWNKAQDVFAVPINVNPRGGMNCFFPMPFRRHARITVTNDSPCELLGFFYTINYTLEAVGEEALYFHAQFRRTNPLAYGDHYTLIDKIEGHGQYVGTFMAWQQNNAGWWGEGEIEMYLDGDEAYPSIVGTGTEDYFGGAWGFAHEQDSRSFSAPYFGYIDASNGQPGCMRAGSRFILYRFHVHDPIFFERELTVRMQALGWRKEGRYLPLQDDIASVVYWYQDLPHAKFPELPSRDRREII